MGSQEIQRRKRLREEIQRLEEQLERKRIRKIAMDRLQGRYARIRKTLPFRGRVIRRRRYIRPVRPQPLPPPQDPYATPQYGSFDDYNRSIGDASGFVP